MNRIMSREEEIKKELEEIKKAKEQEVINNQLESMKLVGKFYASHKLNRYMTNKPSYSFNVYKITGKKYDKSCSWSPYGYTGEFISVSKNGEKFTVNKGEFFDKDLDLWRYEITEKEYNQVANGFIPKIEGFIDELRNEFVVQDWCSQGDWNDDRSSGDHLEKIGIDFIDLSLKGYEYRAKGSNAAILELLRWNHHPYLFNMRLYKVEGWLDIIQNIRDTMYKEALSWGGVIYQRDMPRVETLDKFIKTWKNN